jgi:hypothetical protein
MSYLSKKILREFPIELAEEVERRLGKIFQIVERIEEERWEEKEREQARAERASAIFLLVWTPLRLRIPSRKACQKNPD